MADITTHLRTPKFLLKIVELVLAIISTGLISGQPVGMDIIKDQVVVSCIVAYLFISIFIIATYVLEGHANKFVELMIAVSGAILQLTSAALLFELYDRGSSVNGRVVGAGIVTLVDAIVYGADAVFVFFTSSTS